MKSFERPAQESSQPDAIETELLAKDLTLPHAEAAMSVYAEKYDNDPSHLEKLKEIFQVFVEQGIGNTQVFNSTEVKTSFPWTVIRLQDIAKTLYEAHATLPAPDSSKKSEEVESEHTFAQRQEFIFGSAFAPEHGDEFVFAEEAMHQIIKKIPQALEELKNGKDPENFEVYMAGMPTNLLGEISKEFSDDLKKDPYEYMGRLYADFVAQQSAKEVQGRKAVELYGISMGGGFAAKTGEKLLQNGQATQDTQSPDTKDQKPSLQIKAMVPVSMGHEENENWQIMGGFAIEGGIALATNPAAKKTGELIPDFQKKVNTILARRGIHEKMSDEQKKLKKEAIHSIIFGLGKNLKIDPAVRLTKVVGLQDLTMYTSSFNEEAKDHREENLEENNGEKTLGTQLVPGREKNQRTFGVNVHHALPFFRDSEFKRMKKAAEALESLS